MANKKVSLVRLCKTPKGWKRYPVVMGGNGKVKPEYVLVNGQAVRYPEGNYALRMYQGTKTVYKSVGQDAAEALNSLKRESHLVSAKHSAIAAGVKIIDDAPTGRSLLLRKKTDFIKRLESKGHIRAGETATIAIDDFVEATGLTYEDEVNEASLLKFYRALRKRGNQDRTIYNKHVSLFGFFKWLGLDVTKLSERPPAYTEREVEVFDPEDLRALLSASNDYQRVVFETLLKTGMRMQEAMNLEWVNVDFRGKKIRVREQAETDETDAVTIKDRAERSIPLPDELAVTLKSWKELHPKSRLVLGTVNDTPNWKWLQMLKRVVRRAGLNCGHCPGCRGTKECSRWKLKTFRSTYTTTMLRNGFDARTVMSWTGHSDLATVLRYLAPSDDPNMQKKVSSIAWT